MTITRKPKRPQAPAAKRPSPLTYAGSGVSIDAGNTLVERIKPFAKKTQRKEVISSIGGFGALFDLAKSGYKNPVLVSTTDGVGTKLKVAQAADIHDTIGIDLVAMCVNDLVVQGAEPLFFLDYFGCGKLDVDTAQSVIQGIAEGCTLAGCALVGGETAEMPGMYPDEEYDLAGFAVGAVERGNILPRKTIKAGDVIIGLPSDGLHSNGFSLVRALVKRQGLRWSDAAPFASDKKTLADALLAPTRIYVKSCLQVIEKTGAIKAMAHITGGGLLENPPRVFPEMLEAHIELNRWTLPPVFQWIRKTGPVTQEEMLRTFNCGIGMIAICAEKDAKRVTDAFKKAGEKALIIGTLQKRVGGKRVRFSGAWK